MARELASIFPDLPMGVERDCFLKSFVADGLRRFPGL